MVLPSPSGAALFPSGIGVIFFPTFLIPNIQTQATAVISPETIQYKYFKSLKYSCNFSKTRDENIAPKPPTTAA
jgi:hypothetical protein